MKVVLISHPGFMNIRSIQQYTDKIQNGLIDRGHQVNIWQAKRIFYRLAFYSKISKWLGYIDQFILFPIEIKIRLARTPKDSLFVFVDHALGPLIPYFKNRKIIIHCHDFIAQKSGLNQIIQNRVSVTGKIYQKYIRYGYRKADNFISISKKTQQDLHSHLERTPKFSKVVYNPIDPVYRPTKDQRKLRDELSDIYKIDLNKGYILHVGGNQFYKNRSGVIDIYTRWIKDTDDIQLPLVMVGQPPSTNLVTQKRNSPHGEKIIFLTNISFEKLLQLYQGASLLLFPSLYEGFGWPIAEAMACGCPVITTDQSPMNEVGGQAASYVKKMPMNKGEQKIWQIEAAKLVNKTINRSQKETNDYLKIACLQTENFNLEKQLDLIEKYYLQIAKQ